MLESSQISKDGKVLSVYHVGKHVVVTKKPLSDEQKKKLMRVKDNPESLASFVGGIIGATLLAAPVVFTAVANREPQMIPTLGGAAVMTGYVLGGTAGMSLETKYKNRKLKMKGWKHEPARHALSAKGIKTKRLMK